MGGILVGQDLIKAAETRAQIAQIEKYNAAVNTFRGKFNALPGDMPVATANQFGFDTTNCDGTTGRRDGNGLIDGWAITQELAQAQGETGMFWQDLSSRAAGNLIEGSFPNSGATSNVCATNLASDLTTTPGGTYIGDFMPVGKIGHGTFAYVYDSSGYNWYGLSAVTIVYSGGNAGRMDSTPSIPVAQAYNIDKKVDDGLPTTGSVQAKYLTVWAVTPATNAAADSTTTCYNTTRNAYSIGSVANYGAGGNCALSFRLQ